MAVRIRLRIHLNIRGNAPRLDGRLIPHGSGFLLRITEHPDHQMLRQTNGILLRISKTLGIILRPCGSSPQNQHHRHEKICLFHHLFLLDLMIYDEQSICFLPRKWRREQSKAESLLISNRRCLAGKNRQEKSPETSFPDPMVEHRRFELLTSTMRM